MYKRIIPLIILVLLFLSACNYPLAPTSSANPTPDLTLTALFAPSFPPTWTVSNDSNETIDATSTSDVILPTETISPATSTTSPTMTSTGTTMPMRPGPIAYAYFLNTKPVLDGNWGDWKPYSREYGMDFVVFGASNWEGEEDLQASYMLGWDASFLYVGVKVRDDNYVQYAHGANIYKGDSIELLIDTDLLGDFYTKYLSADDVQLGISPGYESTSGPKEAYLWYPSNVAGSRDQVVITTELEDELYRVEFKVPWSMIGVSPYAGMRLGFTIAVNDNDAEEQLVQQTMMSNNKFRTGFTDPMFWGEMILR